ncbi:MAG: GGDEF domain-containing protein [Micromonosporaceae bacterium]|nr:GGDEF domain-containing protein [Micromonosporaceae bacterium]
MGGVLVAGAAATGSPWFPAAAAVLALVTGIVAILVRRPARPWAWWLFLVSTAAVMLARLSQATNIESRIEPRGSAFSDIRALITYAALSAALLLVAGRPTRQTLAEWLDAAIVALGAFLLIWLFLLGGELILTASTPVIDFVRPIAVAVVTGLLARLLFVVDRRTPSFWLLVAATGFLIAAAVVAIGHQVGYPLMTTFGQTGLWSATYTILVAAALLHPSSAAPLVTRERSESELTVPLGVVFAALTLLGPFIWVVAVVPSPFRPESVWDLGLPIIIAALISLLLLWRLAMITQLADSRADMLDAAQKELEYRATHDPLTGLANRAELISQLELLVGRPGPNRGRHALLLLDIDGFKRINDSFGHPVGDEVLMGVGRRLVEDSPPGSMPVRLGGDEFAVLLTDVDERTAVDCAEMIRQRLNQPFVTSAGEMAISASVGVSLTPRVEKSTSEVLRDADVALYHAKAAGKNQVRTYDGQAR